MDSVHNFAAQPSGPVLRRHLAPFCSAVDIWVIESWSQPPILSVIVSIISLLMKSALDVCRYV